MPLSFDHATRALRILDTPIGTLAIHASDRGVSRITLAVARAVSDVEAALPTPAPPEPDAARRHCDTAARAIDQYFAGTRRHFDELALDAAGSGFQQAVWKALRDIPYGATESYGSLAARIGRPGAARAVGMANHRNPLAIVVPCHRVIGAGGALAGYAGGLAAKRSLLEHEGVALDGSTPGRRASPGSGS